MTCSDYLPATGRDCHRPAAFIVEWEQVAGTRITLPKCALHARRYRDDVAPVGVVLRPIEAPDA